MRFESVSYTAWGGSDDVDKQMGSLVLVWSFD
jgi:hypothetical protein